MNDIRTFHAPGLQVEQLVQAIGQWYQSQGFEVRLAPLPDGTLLQARQEGGWRSAFGTSSALQVVVRPHGDDVVIEMGAGKWGDKAAAGAVGAFLLWPLAFTAAYGAWQQSKLPDKTFEFVERWLAGGVQMPIQSAPVLSPGVAPAGPPPAPAASGAAQPAQASNGAQGGGGFCIKCGQALPQGAAFCQHCGTKVAA